MLDTATVACDPGIFQGLTGASQEAEQVTASGTWHISLGVIMPESPCKGVADYAGFDQCLIAVGIVISALPVSTAVHRTDDMLESFGYQPCLRAWYQYHSCSSL